MAFLFQGLGDRESTSGITFPEFRALYVDQVANRGEVGQNAALATSVADGLPMDTEMKLSDIFKDHAELAGSGAENGDRIPKEQLARGLKKSLQAARLMGLQRSIHEKAVDVASSDAMAFIFEGIGGSANS